MRIHLIGYGKMGKKIHQLMVNYNIQLGEIISSTTELTKSLEEKRNGDVYIDFTQPDVVSKNLKILGNAGARVVCGTTGWNEHKQEIEALFERNNGAFLFASNFSIGMNLVFIVNEQMARLAEQFSEFELRIEETHHIHKKDSPSGTAVSLARGIIENNRNYTQWSLDSNEPGTLSIQAIREGEVFGEHEVVYENASEKLIISHSAKNRKVFAEGALTAARFISDKTGIFGMRDVLLKNE